MLLIGTACLLAQRDSSSRFVRLTYANDYFRATDYYFTQGIQLTYGRGLQHFFVRQEGYTPTSIRVATVQRGDRPYAGTLVVGYGVGERGRGRRCPALGTATYSFALTAGIIGPASLAEAEQKWIHRQTGNVEPRGWGNQIQHAPIVNGQLTVYRPFIRKSWLTVGGRAQLMAGTYRTRASLGADLSLGRPDHPASNRATSAGLFLRPTLRLVGYDASLQGSPIADRSPYTLGAGDIQRFVGSVQGGIGVNLWRLSLRFSHTYLSPEFAGGRRHAWGTVEVEYGW